MELKDMTIEQLQERRQSILSSCSHWIDSNDGSYERACHYAGLTEVNKEIKRQRQLDVVRIKNEKQWL